MMTSQVLVNDLANIPHHDGQTVLHALREDFEVQVNYSRGVDHVYGFVRKNGRPHFTRLAAQRRTVRQARDLARRAWKEGASFDTITGCLAERP
jgi:hypothetical protein